MKRSYQTIVLLFSISFLFSCGTKEISQDRLVERNGVFYEVNSQTPFTGKGIQTYENGQLEDKLSYKDGKLEGPVEFYYENGQLNSKGFFKGGDNDGPWEYYHTNGQLMIKGSFKDGQPEGPTESYYENGQLKEKLSYKDGNADGLREEYSENGELLSRNCYKNWEETDMSYCEK